jgi:hypothetical protein
MAEYPGPHAARPLAEWRYGDGPALWWLFPIEEPPYCGTPHCSDWPGYHTHWTPVPLPALPWPEPQPEPQEQQP